MPYKLTRQHLAHLRRYAKIAGAKRRRLAMKRRPRLKCKRCKRIYTVPPSLRTRRVYCSNVCRYKHKVGRRGANYGNHDGIKGAKNPQWKGGIVPPSWARCGPRMTRWRKLVLARDNYKCRRCKRRKRRLTAHHLFSWKRYPKLRYVLANGLCLCKKCHNWVHSLKNKRKSFLRGL